MSKPNNENRDLDLEAKVKEVKVKAHDRVSDVVENGGCFASKILTHNRMH